MGPLPPAMAASQLNLPSSLAGLPAILDPSAATFHSPSSCTQQSQDEADIKTLLRALPTKADMEGLVLRVEEQHRRDFQQLHAEVQSLADQSLADLTILRSQLHDLALDKAKATIAKCRRTFYEHSDKCGKLLAWALRAQQARTFVPELLDEGNAKAHATERIADIFRQYYASLYNLPQSTREVSSRRLAIREYLQRSGVPRISDDDLTNLDEPLSLQRKWP